MAKERIDYTELKERLQKIYIEEHKVFIMLTYAVLGRVGEIVKGNYSPNPPIAPDQITTKRSKKGRNLLVIEVLTEKTKKLRRVPISRDKEPWLTEPIIEYAARARGPLFNYTTRWGQKVFAKYFGTEHIHLLRGYRVNHLRDGSVTGKIMDWGIIAKMGGWTNTKTPQAMYDGTIIEDFEDEL